MQGPFVGNRTLKSYQNPPIRNHILVNSFMTVYNVVLAKTKIPISPFRNLNQIGQKLFWHRVFHSTWMVKKVGPRLRELVPAARTRQDAGSRNLGPSFWTIIVHRIFFSVG